MIPIILLSCFLGLKNFLRDVDFMLGIRLGIYWKFTWGLFIPISLMGIFIYSFINFPAFMDKTTGYFYPTSLTASGWVLAVLALIQIPIWGIYAIHKQKKGSFIDVSQLLV